MNESNASNPVQSEQPIVVLCEPIAPAPKAWLETQVQLIEPNAQSPHELFPHLTNADALIVRTYTIVNTELLDHAPNLKVIARAGVGLDNIDLKACKARSIRVVHTPSANTSAVVEYVTQTMLNALRSITTVSNPSTDQHWHTLREKSITPKTCVGTRLGIVGFGKIGSSLARVASALGMEVVYHDLKDIDECDRHGAVPMSLDELANAASVISVHVDARAANHHLLTDDFFSKLKPDTILINTSRGMVIDPIAAASFARSNPQSSLILDVHDPEPIAPYSPLLGLPNVMLTPHIAAGTRSAKENMSWVVRDILRVLKGDEPDFPAN